MYDFTIEYNIALIKSFKRYFINNKLKNIKISFFDMNTKIIIDIIKKYKFSNCLEIGMGSGILSFYILSNAKTNLISIDPYQKSKYNNSGINLLKDFNFDKRFKINNLDFNKALPDLLNEFGNNYFDFILISELSSSENILFYFYYANLLLKVNGIIVIVNSLYDEIMKSLDFIKVNYEFYKKLDSPLEVTIFMKLKEDTRIYDKTTWRKNLPAVIWSKTKNFIDENNKMINPYNHEFFEQYLVYKWIKNDDIVLELGARYGIVSCTINSLLMNKENHVVVEPDKNVISALERNKKTFDAKFKICKYAISNTPLKFIKNENGLGNYVIESNKKSNNISHITSKIFFSKYDLAFNVLIVDCEGCLCKFLNENNDLLKKLRLIIFEKDNEELCNYETIINKLVKNKFKKVDRIINKNNNEVQQVWLKENVSAKIEMQR